MINYVCQYPVTSPYDSSRRQRISRTCSELGTLGHKMKDTILVEWYPLFIVRIFIQPMDGVLVIILLAGTHLAISPILILYPDKYC